MFSLLKSFCSKFSAWLEAAHLFYICRGNYTLQQSSSHRPSTGKVQYEDLRFTRPWMQIGAYVERYPRVVVACKTWEEDHRHCYSSSRESLQRVNLIYAGDRIPWGALQGCEVQPCSINTFDSITSFNIFCRLPRENHISTCLNELDICIPHRNLIKPSQAVKTGEDETCNRHQWHLSIRCWKAQALQWWPQSHSEVRDKRGSQNFTSMEEMENTATLTHMFSARCGGKWRYQHGNNSAKIFFHDFQPLQLPCRYKGHRQHYPVIKDHKLNIEHCNLRFFSTFWIPCGFVQLNIWLLYVPYLFTSLSRYGPWALMSKCP